MKTLKPEYYKKYIREIEATGDLISYRHKDYPANSPSKKEGRFNLDGRTAYYAASGDACAKHEVPNISERECYEIKRGAIIHAFDLPLFAKEHDCSDIFLLSKEEGGYSICQELAEYLTTQTPPVSGILYQSHALNEKGQIGYNLVILPINNETLEEAFFEKRK